MGVQQTAHLRVLALEGPDDLFGQRRIELRTELHLSPSAPRHSLRPDGDQAHRGHLS